MRFLLHEEYAGEDVVNNAYKSNEREEDKRLRDMEALSEERRHSKANTAIRSSCCQQQQSIIIMASQHHLRAIYVAICALSLVPIVALTVRQMSPSFGRMVRQQHWNSTGVGQSYTVTPFYQQARLSISPVISNLSTTTAKGLDPFGELGQWPPIVYPELYRSLSGRRLPGSPANAAAGFPLAAPAKEGLPPCKWPVSRNLAKLLEQSPAGFPYKRPHRGGFWSPGVDSCWPPLSRTAVLVPYRNRSQNLDLFIPYMHTLLQQQNIVYGIFVIEQANLKLFNRAKLLNVGFKMSQQFGPFDCFVFQDADKVPENVANVFECGNSPKLMMSAIRPQLGPKSKQYRQGKLYISFFGAAVAVTKKIFEQINGNSNRYYGWGREDDELAVRMSLRGFRIHYPGGRDKRFVNLHHSHDIVGNSMPWPYAQNVRASMDKDGLNSLSYGDRGIYLHDLFTLIRADV